MAALGSRVSGAPVWLLGLVPLALIVAAVALFAALGGPGLGDRRGPPVEELAVERTVLEPGVIELTVRNDGPDAVTVAQAVVNDAFVEFTGAEEPIGRLEHRPLDRELLRRRAAAVAEPGRAQRGEEPDRRDDQRERDEPEQPDGRPSDP